jgi:hypothetical protein
MSLLLQKANKIIVFDGFNRANNALTLGNADTGQSWSEEAGIWGVIDGTAYIATPSAGNNFAVIDVSPYDNYIIRGKFAVNTAEGRILFRYLNADNRLNITRISQAYTLYKTIDGVYTAIGSNAKTPKDNDIVEVRLNDGNIKVLINGELIIDIEESTFQSVTKCGISGNLNNRTVRFDNFTVEAI